MRSAQRTVSSIKLSKSNCNYCSGTPVNSGAPHGVVNTLKKGDKMKYKLKVVGEEKDIELSTKNELFFSVRTNRDESLEDIYLSHDEHVVLNGDYFDSIDEFITWSNSLIEKIKVVQIEVKKLQKKPTKKDSKKK